MATKWEDITASVNKALLAIKDDLQTMGMKQVLAYLADKLDMDKEGIQQFKTDIKLASMKVLEGVTEAEPKEVEQNNKKRKLVESEEADEKKAEEPKQKKQRVRIEEKTKQDKKQQINGKKDNEEKQSQGKKKQKQKGSEVGSSSKWDSKADKQLQHMRNLCRTASIGISPKIYKKSVEEQKDYLKELLNKHDLSQKSTIDEAKKAKKRIELAKDMMDIQVSNVIEGGGVAGGGGRRSRRAAATAAQTKMKKKDEKQSSDDEGDEEEEEEEEESSEYRESSEDEQQDDDQKNKDVDLPVEQAESQEEDDDGEDDEDEQKSQQDDVDDVADSD